MKLLLILIISLVNFAMAQESIWAKRDSIAEKKISQRMENLQDQIQLAKRADAEGVPLSTSSQASVEHQLELFFLFPKRLKRPDFRRFLKWKLQLSCQALEVEMVNILIKAYPELVEGKSDILLYILREGLKNEHQEVAEIHQRRELVKVVTQAGALTNRIDVQLKLTNPHFLENIDPFVYYQITKKEVKNTPQAVVKKIFGGSDGCSVGEAVKRSPASAADGRGNEPLFTHNPNRSRQP